MSRHSIVIFLFISSFFLSSSFIYCSKPTYVDKASLHAPQTVHTEREKFKKNLIKEINQDSANFDYSEKHLSYWNRVFWGMQLIRYRSESTQHVIEKALKNYFYLPPSLQKTSIDAACSLYPSDFHKKMRSIAGSTISPEHFSLTVHYVLINDSSDSGRYYYSNLLERKFPDWRDDPVLFMCHSYLQTSDKWMSQRPPLLDLVNHEIFKEEPIIFSFHRSDRSYPGLVIFRKPDGHFLRTTADEIWSIPQLARSLSNTPSYLKNGNSPQGIYSLQGISNSKNIFIGPSPTLQMVLPFETSIDTYFHRELSENNEWSIEIYQQLLPMSWKNYSPIYETYYAGKAGRSEIICHGTTIDSEYFRGEVFYPFTSSLGCLTTREIWSGVDGSCVISDQLDLINAYLSSGNKKGFLMLIDLDDKRKEVTIEDIPKEIFLSENKF